MFALNVVDHGIELRSGQTKNYNIGICCFSANHAALRSKNKDQLVRNQNNVFEWRDISTHGHNTIKIQLSMLVQYKADITSISLNVTCSHHGIFSYLVLNDNHSLTRSISCIFSTRTNSTISWEVEMEQPKKQLFTATEKVWRIKCYKIVTARRVASLVLSRNRDPIFIGTGIGLLIYFY